MVSWGYRHGVGHAREGKWVTFHNIRNSREAKKMLVPVIIVIGFTLLWFFRTLYLKFAYPYEGRHHLNRVKTVLPTYHPNDSAWVPVPVRNRAWWNARMSRLRKVSYLYTPLPELWERMKAERENENQQWIAWMGTNYRWEHLPLSLWPDSWKLPESIDLSKCIAGSDLPARALKVIEPLKSFQITVAGRLAA